MNIIKPIKIVDYKKFYEGTIFKNKNGDAFKIIEYNNSHDISVQFLDKYGYIGKATTSDINRKYIWNPFHPNRFGAFIGGTEYLPKDNLSVYNKWMGMLDRVYNKNNKENLLYYSNTYVSEEWFNFQNFSSWFYDYITKINYDDTFQIDKDIYQFEKEIKIYSKDTCCIIPAKLNSVIASMSNRKRISDDIPFDVGIKPNNTYYYSIMIDGKIYDKYGFKNQEDAFNEVKNIKLNYIHELANIYIKNNNITNEVYELIYKIDIKPY